MPKSSSELIASGKINTLSIGDGGKGKTFLIGTMIDAGFKPYIIDAENGLKTIANKVFDYDEVSTWDDFLVKVAWYYNNYKERGYTHLVVDSITRLQQYLAVKINKDGKLNQAQWGEVLASLRAVVDRITKTCPTSLHVTAMAMEAKDELTGAVKIFPNIQGSFKFDLAGYFDIVLYHECGERDGKQAYWVQTQADQRIQARNRYDHACKLNKYEPSNYAVFSKLINGGK